jgi:hypothetical protein
LIEIDEKLSIIRVKNNHLDFKKSMDVDLAR